MTRQLFICFAIVFASVSSAGCSQLTDQIADIFAPKIDSTSADTFADSILKARNDLSDEDKDKFDVAMAYFSLEYLKNNPGQAVVAGAVAIFGDSNNKVGNAITNNLTKDFIMQFHKKTAKGIIREYEKANKH